MSSLNLVPNAHLMAAQAVVFFANIFVVKKLMVDPYLEMKEKRDAGTTGSDLFATELLKSCEEKEQTIAHKSALVLSKAHELRNEMKEKARAEQAALYQNAKAESEKKLQMFSQQVRTSFDEERKKISQYVSALSDEVYKKILL